MTRPLDTIVHDIRLSEHFALSEFTASQTARARHIDNTPSLSAVANLQQLCVHVLEPLRQHVGTPIRINSGYRCAALNKAVGGAKASQHLTGNAVDIFVPSDEQGKDMFLFIKEHCQFDQLISERNSKQSSSWWIHVSFTDRPRKQVINSLIKNK